MSKIAKVVREVRTEFYGREYRAEVVMTGQAAVHLLVRYTTSKGWHVSKPSQRPITSHYEQNIARESEQVFQELLAENLAIL